MRTISDLYGFSGEEVWNSPHEIIECKRALSPSSLPGIDYALNPYGGCEHGCIYCYAPEVTHTPWSQWRVVKVKSNIISRLGKELPNVSGTIGIGTVTDPYQAAESRFELTRACLKKLKADGFRVHLHTKSDLILRDLDTIEGMKGDFAVTITTLDDRISKRTEPGAPLPENRLRALKELTDIGADTYALIGPIFSTLDGKEGEFVDAIASTGVRRMYIDKFNERPMLKQRTDVVKLSGSNAALENIRRLATAKGIKVFDVF